MFKNDYLMRMIEQLGDILRKVLSLEEDHKFKACHDEIDAAMKQLGISRLLVRTMPTGEILHLVRRPGSMDDDRCVLLSRLISADAHVYLTEGKKDVAHNLYTTSLGILTELSKNSEGENLEQIKEDMDGVRLCISENLQDNNDSLDI
jgi:hypothetical protein